MSLTTDDTIRSLIERTLFSRPFLESIVDGWAELHDQACDGCLNLDQYVDIQEFDSDTFYYLSIDDSDHALYECTRDGRGDPCTTGLVRIYLNAEDALDPCSVDYEEYGVNELQDRLDSGDYIDSDDEPAVTVQTLERIFNDQSDNLDHDYLPNVQAAYRSQLDTLSASLLSKLEARGFTVRLDPSIGGNSINGEVRLIEDGYVFTWFYLHPFSYSTLVDYYRSHHISYAVKSTDPAFIRDIKEKKMSGELPEPKDPAWLTHLYDTLHEFEVEQHIQPLTPPIRIINREGVA
jgi:hypothetical protein